MTWLWNKIGWFGRLKLRFWVWVFMVFGLVEGGSAAARLLTHDAAEGRITAVRELCKISCKSSRDLPGYRQIAAADCTSIRAKIVLRGVEGRCTPKTERLYGIRIAADNADITLRAADFAHAYPRGATIPLMRSASASPTFSPPPRDTDFFLLAIGVALFGWLVLRPAMRVRSVPPRRAKPGADLSAIPSTRAAKRAPKRKRASRTFAWPGRRYVINGPIKTWIR